MHAGKKEKRNNFYPRANWSITSYECSGMFHYPRKFNKPPKKATIFKETSTHFLKEHSVFPEEPGNSPEIQTNYLEEPNQCSAPVSNCLENPGPYLKVPTHSLPAQSN
jgi:hypothetical protein